MEPVDPYFYYRLGVAMKELLIIKDEPTPTFRDIFFQIIDAHNALDELMKSGLEHSKTAATDVKNRLYELPSDTRDENGNINFNQSLTQWRISNVKQAVRDFQTILIRECPTLPIFFIALKGLHRTVDLINHAELDFPEEIRKLMPTNAIEEIRQGGKALALDMFTAYAFHAMRAAELVMLMLLHDYYNADIPESGRKLG